MSDELPLEAHHVFDFLGASEAHAALISTDKKLDPAGFSDVLAATSLEQLHCALAAADGAQLEDARADVLAIDTLNRATYDILPRLGGPPEMRALPALAEPEPVTIAACAMQMLAISHLSVDRYERQLQLARSATRFLESLDRLALDVDAIITGTRSLHGMREVLSNALSHALLQHSRRPVLAIPKR